MTQISRYFKKKALSKIPVTSNFAFAIVLQARHDYVHSIVPIVHYFELVLVDKTLCKTLLSFLKEMILVQFLWGNVLLRGELQIDAINSNFQTLASLRASCI